MIGSKFSRHFVNQSEVKSKPIMACTCTFSCALCRQHVTTLSFDWFTGSSVSFLIGQSTVITLVLVSGHSIGIALTACNNHFSCSILKYAALVDANVIEVLCIVIYGARLKSPSMNLKTVKLSLKRKTISLSLK